MYVDEMKDGHLVNCYNMLHRWNNSGFYPIELVRPALRVFELEAKRRDKTIAVN